MKAVMYLVLLLLLHFLIEETESKAAKGKKKGCCGWWSRNCSCHHRDLVKKSVTFLNFSIYILAFVNIEDG